MLSHQVISALIYLRKFLNDFLKDVEPDAVRQRRVFKFKRKRFFSAGVMDILCFDQHDKWKRFGLWLHLGIDPYPGQLHWLKIWWTNRNPVLVTGYYLEACRKAGGIYYLHYFVTRSLTSCIRYPSNHAERSWRRKLWHCQLPHSDTPAS